MTRVASIVMVETVLGSGVPCTRGFWFLRMVGWEERGSQHTRFLVFPRGLGAKEPWGYRKSGSSSIYIIFFNSLN